MQNDAEPGSGKQAGAAGSSAQSHFHDSTFHGPVHTGTGALNVYHITSASADPLERLALALARKVAAVERQARLSLLGEAGTAAEIPYTSRLTWLGHDGGTIEVNVETKKPGVVPISFLYSNSLESEARETLGQVLPELEPRLPTATDSISRYFRL